MSHPDISDTELAPFRQLAEDKHLTLLLGAGASVPSGLPTWEELAITLAVRSGLVDNTEMAELLLSAPGQDLSFVMQAVQQKAGESWVELLVEALDVGTGPSELHRAAVAHYLHNPARSTLATLNFDVLLEQAIWTELSDSHLSDRTVSIFESDEIEDTGPGVVHLHGHAFRGSSGNIVAGFDDYMALMTAHRPWQQAFLEDALERGSLLLAGTSYNDPDIRHWLHQALKPQARKNKALVAIVREGMRKIGGTGSISKEEFAGIQKALEAEWLSIGIQPIFMHDYADVARVIAELTKLGQPGYRTPKEIAESVWVAHTQQLEECQASYEQQLTEHSLLLKQSLRGSPVHRATLWLSDGAGQLARWGSQGSRFTTLSDMKRIPTGHDSDWIAGEALSSMSFTLKSVARTTRSRPSWKTVLAVPVQVEQINTAVITFGIDRTERFILDNPDWPDVAGQIGEEWGDILEQTRRTLRD